MNKKIERDFRTLRGYQKDDEISSLSPAMEDYLEMTSRLCDENGSARTGDISAALHVKPSSASKMIAKLKSSGHLMIDRDNNIYMTAQGKKAAAYLLYRHETIECFLTAIGSGNALRETEQIEHFLSPQTVRAIEKVSICLQQAEDLTKSEAE